MPEVVMLISVTSVATLVSLTTPAITVIVLNVRHSPKNDGLRQEKMICLTSDIFM